MRVATERYNYWPPADVTLNNAVTFETSKQRNGLGCAKCAAEGNNYVQRTLTTVLARTYFFRFAFRVSALPSSNAGIGRIESETSKSLLEFTVRTTGKLNVFSSVVPSGNVPTGFETASAIEPEKWYVWETKVKIPTEGNSEISWRVLNNDGTTFQAEQSETRTLENKVMLRTRYGNLSSRNISIYIDDTAVNDDQGSNNNTYLGSTYPVIPTAERTHCYIGATMDGDLGILEGEAARADAPYNGSGQLTWDRFEAHAGKRVAVVGYSDPWKVAGEGGILWDGFGTSSANAYGRKAISLKAMGSPNSTILEDVNAGTYDASITLWAEEAAKFKHPIFVRPWWEMNFSGATWNWSGKTPSVYIEAWKRLHDKIKAKAKNVSMCWVPNILPGALDFEQYYPGDEYVDWVGFNGYSGTNPLKSPGWRAPDLNFIPTYERMREVTSTKPMIITEVGCSEFGGNKAEWITELFTRVIPAMPAVKAVMWFNWNITAGEGRLDWPIESSKAAEEAFRGAISSSYYVGAPQVLKDNALVSEPAPPVIETVREVPDPEGSPEISIEFSPHKEEYTYNVGGETVKPSPTVYYAHINEAVTLTATVTFANPTKQWAVGYRWDLGDGTIAYNNPATHTYTLPSTHLQVGLTVFDNKGQEWRARKAMYLK